MAFTDRIKGIFTSSPLPKYQDIVKKINALEEEYKALPDADFPKKTAEFKAALTRGENGNSKSGKTLDDILPEAFALVREASRRQLKQRHYDVQLLGGIVLHSGDIAEMRTGWQRGQCLLRGVRRLGRPEPRHGRAPTFSPAAPQDPPRCK